DSIVAWASTIRQNGAAPGRGVRSVTLEPPPGELEEHVLQRSLAEGHRLDADPVVGGPTVDGRTEGGFLTGSEVPVDDETYGRRRSAGEFLGRTGGDETAPVDDVHQIGEVLGFLEVVRGEHHGDAGLP